MLEFVHFEYLSGEAINAFVNWSAGNVDWLNWAVWERLCVRLTLPVVPRMMRFKSLSRPLPGPNSLDGIIAYLSRIGRGNVHDLNVVQVTASSRYAQNPVCDPKNIADLEVHSNFGSLNMPNQWICYDFQDMRIRPTHYSIKSSYDARVNDANLKSWVVEVSISGSEWDIIDQRDMNNELNGPNRIRSFPVSDVEECRYIRLRQTGKNHSGTDFLIFSAFEVFGTLFEAKKRSLP
jgi:hypothetical protein